MVSLSLYTAANFTCVRRSEIANQVLPTYPRRYTMTRREQELAYRVVDVEDLTRYLEG